LFYYIIEILKIVDYNTEVIEIKFLVRQIKAKDAKKSKLRTELETEERNWIL